MKNTRLNWKKYEIKGFNLALIKRIEKQKIKLKTNMKLKGLINSD